MKEEIYAQEMKINILSSSENSSAYEVRLEEDICNNKKECANYLTNSCNESKKQNETEPIGNDIQTEIATDQECSTDENSNNLGDQKKYLLNKLKNLKNEKIYPNNFQHFSKAEKIDFLFNYIKSEEEDCENQFKNLPDEIINLFIGLHFEIDYGISRDTKPDWLDLEKFKKGQKFAMDHYFGVCYAQLLSLFILFSFEEGIKPLIFTGKSSTPYTAFKRYTSTARRVRNWYTEDPWNEGTAAYNDMQTVRKMHAAVRKKLDEIDNETIDAVTKIENPFCPSRDILLKDFQSACPAPSLGQCPILLYKNPEIMNLRPKGLNQAEMALTQFGFLGLVILYPSKFCINDATEENLEAFCHTWRGIGYILGIDDEFNLCRGTLDEIRQRCKIFLEYWALPNFRELTPECEHMMRCLVESLQYYFPGSRYEICVLYLSEMLNLDMPRLYSSLTYRLWLRHICFKTVNLLACKVPGVLSLANRRTSDALDKALNYSPEKHEELKRRSEETLKNAVNDFES